jgi:methylase of polypeptide subunit release factors
MSNEQVSEIRRRLDEDLSRDEFERDYRDTEDAAAQFFQDLFVEMLNFDEFGSPLGDETWQSLPVHEWSNSSRARSARIIAESGVFRVVYAELEKLTRTAERNSIRSLTRSERTSGWAIEGSFLVVFHAPDEDVWHLVTPYEENTEDITTGRPVLRRYTLGEGETHRTVSKSLADMDASKPGRLADKVEDAFRVKPVTKEFYDKYKDVFDSLKGELREKYEDKEGRDEIEEADRYSHVTLNRLMFFYYLQKKGWIGDRKDFMRWFHEKYEESDDTDVFHEKWLSALFFDGMNQEEGEPVEADLPDEVSEAVSGLAYMNGGLFQPRELDNEDVYISDEQLYQVIHGFLEQYNFTVTEESPYDIDVAVDPAMLGKIYESLIAEQERDEAGIFYTPRVEVDLMCRMSLYEQFCERLDDPTDEEKERIVEFVFSEPDDWDSEETGDTEKLEEIIHELRIVDPACGSGAFLVGMKQVLTELYRKLGVTPDYNLKEQIINENIYGVDIKDWAVRVAEFRLWLSLVEGEDEIPEQRPVLPNFSFKLTTGDSIVQTLEGEPMSLDDIKQRANREEGSSLHEQLQQVLNIKSDYFYGESGLSEDEIEEEQRNLLIEYVEDSIENLEKEDVSQKKLGGGTTEESEKEAEQIQRRIEQLKRTKERIEQVEELFIWELTYPELIVNDGFDIVLGNPPYVRNENIINQGIDPDTLEELEEEEISEKQDRYKNELREYVDRNFDIDIGGQIDLYLYFFFRGVDLLRPGGTLNLITSNSWLDTEFGQSIQELLLSETSPQYILDNTSMRSFDEADINTVITVAQRKNHTALGEDLGFVSVKSPYSDMGKQQIENLLLGSHQSSFQVYEEKAKSLITEEFRRIDISTDSLWRLGGGETEEDSSDDEDLVFSEKTGISGGQRAVGSFSKDQEVRYPRGSYEGEKWGQFIHAPDSFFRFLDEGDEQLVHLGQKEDKLGYVDSGINTRANRFFYLYDVPRDEWDDVDIHNFEDDDYPEGCRVVRSEIGTWKGRGCSPPVEDTYWLMEEEYLRPVVQSPRQSMSIRLDVSELETLVLSVYDDWDELEGTYVRDYIEYAKSSKTVTRDSNGEEVEVLKVNERPELSKRKQSLNDGSDAVWWYEVIDKNYSRILLPKSCGYSFRTILTTNLIPVDNNVYCFVFDSEPSDKELVGMTLYLNSTIVALLRELYGRSNLGQGGLKTEGVDWSRMPSPDRDTLVEIAEEYSRTEELFDRRIEKIWEEVNEDDKKELDRVIFDLIGVDEELVSELQDRTVELVQARKEKANSS